mgnify:CR=1 FL=1
MYIGQSPSIGNFQVCDAISVVNGQAAYTMQVSSVNVVPETANHMIVSLNGIIQKPGSSFTVSGSTITFASNLATGDVIDFIHILGSVLDLGVPSDDTVTAAKISANAVTGAKLNTDVISAQTALATEPADTDEFLVSDGGVLKRIDYSLIKGGGGLVHINTTTVTSGVSEVAFTSGIDSTYDTYKLFISGMHPATDNKHVQFHYSNDGGSSYLSSNYVFAGYASNASGTHGNQASGSASNIELTKERVGNANDESFNAEITMYQFHKTEFHKCISYHSSYFDLSGNVTLLIGAGSMTANESAVDAVRVKFESGNIDKGTFSLFGVVKS